MSELQFELRSFSAASLEQYRELICDPAVTKHMPLAETAYSDDWIQNWIRSKENTWLEKIADHGQFGSTKISRVGLALSPMMGF